MFGDMVRTHRRRVGMTQEELAERTGVSVRGIRNIEVGRISAPRPGTVRLLADALALSGPDRERFCQAALGAPAPNPPAQAAPARAVPARAVPAQLPAAVAAFAGRGEHLKRLDALLPDTHDEDNHDDNNHNHNGRGTTAVVISAIAGTAGVGKTTLAVYWAHQVRDRFPDGQLYVNLRGFGPAGTAMAPGEAIRGFLEALEVAPQRIPATLDAQAALYRSLLAGKRVLVVLDNARDVDQVRPLLPGAPGCLALVTSRNQLFGLIAAEGASPLTLDVLSGEESRELLARRLGPQRVAAEPEAAAEIITRCARLPLALAVAAARAVAYPHFPLAALAGELGEARDRLDSLDGGDPTTGVRAVLSWSYRGLPPQAARLFRLLGLHPGPDLSVAAAASLAGLPADQVRPLLAELTRAHLVDEHSPGRYSFHDLLRAYAAEQAHSHDADTDRRAAVHRLLGHFLRTAYAADRLLDPHRDPIALAPPAPGVTPGDPVDYEQAMTWFTTEHAALLAAVGQAARAGFATHAWQLAWALETFLYRQGHWLDLLDCQTTALDATRGCADSAGQAYAHCGLAHAYGRLGRYGDVHAHLGQALDLFGLLGDEIGQARTHRMIGLALGHQGRAREALDRNRYALDLYRAAGHRAGQAWALNAVGWYHAQLGDHEQALASCEQALALMRELGHRNGEANTWDSLGYAHHHLGRHRQAVVCYQHAVELCRELGHRYKEALALDCLGDVHHAVADADAARDAWRRAVAILDELAHPDAATVRAKIHGLDEAGGSRDGTPGPGTAPPRYSAAAAGRTA